MPNWCETYITFMSDGTPEGSVAIQKLHDDFINASKLADPFQDLWESDLENYYFGMGNGLFVWNSIIPCSKRGHIASVSDVAYDSFHVVTYDAWSANIAFFAVLIGQIYGSRIQFTFTASEPGMTCYYTNDPGMVPRYNMNIIADTDSEMLNIPMAWDPAHSDNLFKFLNKNNPYVYSYRPESMLPSKWHTSYRLNVEGDDDTCIMEAEEWFFGEDRDDIKSIDDLSKEVEKYGCKLYKNDYVLTTIEDEIMNDVIGNAILSTVSTAIDEEKLNSNINANDIVTSQINDILKIAPMYEGRLTTIEDGVIEVTKF